MHKYKSLITGSLIAIMVIISPLVTSAGNSDKENKDRVIKGEIHREQKLENNRKENSWFNSSWFKISKNKLTETPVISEIVVKTNKIHKATISWKTSVQSNSYVWLSKTPGVDTETKPTIKKNGKVLSHKIELKKLEANTKYYIIVGSANGQGRIQSAETSFTTNQVIENNTNHSIMNLEGKKIIEIGDNAKIKVDVSNKNIENLSISADWGDKDNLEISRNQSPENSKTSSNISFNHIYKTVGTYTATFEVINSTGKKDSKSIEIKVIPRESREKSPLISNIETKVNGTNVTISWTTDLPSTSSIYYDAKTPVDTTSSNILKVENSRLVRNHTIGMPSLAPSTLYHFILKSVDSANNVALSIESAFQTN